MFPLRFRTQRWARSVNRGFSPSFPVSVETQYFLSRGAQRSPSGSFRECAPENRFRDVTSSCVSDHIGASKKKSAVLTPTREAREAPSRCVVAPKVMPAPAASAAVVESPSRALLGSAPGQKEPVWRAAKPPAAGDAGVPPGKAASVPSEPTAAVPSGHVGAVWRNPIPSGSSTSSLEASSGDNPSSSSVADALEQFAVADSDPGQGEEKKISSAEDGAMASSSKKSPAGKSGMKTSTEKKPAMKAVMKKAAAKVSPKPSAKGSPKKGASAASQKRPRSPAKDDGAASPAAKRAKTDKAPAMKKAAKIPALYQEWHDAKTCIPWPGDHNKVQKGAGVGTSIFFEPFYRLFGTANYCQRLLDSRYLNVCCQE